MKTKIFVHTNQNYQTKDFGNYNGIGKLNTVILVRMVNIDKKVQ